MNHQLQTINFVKYYTKYNPKKSNIFWRKVLYTAFFIRRAYRVLCIVCRGFL